MRRRLLDLKAIRARVDAFHGAAEWAKRAARPSDEEIDALQTRIRGEEDKLSHATEEQRTGPLAKPRSPCADPTVKTRCDHMSTTVAAWSRCWAEQPMTDNQSYQQRVARLSEVRRRASTDKRAAVLAALADLQREDRRITRRTVIACAGVHRNFLQRHKDLADQIDTAAGERRTERGVPPTDQITVESLRAELASAKHRNHELSNRVQALERRLGAQGATIGPAVIYHHPVVLELQARLAHLQVQLVEKDRAIESLQDDVDVLRETNRSLVREYGLSAST
jgi:uncharacterized coiled-coil protein SlyX